MMGINLLKNFSQMRSISTTGSRHFLILHRILSEQFQIADSEIEL